MDNKAIKVGDIVEVDGEKYRVEDVGPRNKFEHLPKVELLGLGILGRHLKTDTREYFLDIDLD